MAAPLVPLLVSIPGDIDPLERGERFEVPISRALRQGGRLGRVVGGGTSMCLGGPRFVTDCYVDLDVTDVARALPVLQKALREAEAPRGTRVLHCYTEEVLLITPAAGTVGPPRRRTPVPEYPWEQGEILGYRLSANVVALLYVIQAGRNPIFRVLDWSGPAVPATNEVRELLEQRETRHAVASRLYAVGWAPLGLRGATRMARLDTQRLERPGVVVPFRQRYLHDRYFAFDSGTRFDTLLRQLFGLAPMTAVERLANELGLGTRAHHFAVWTASGPVSADQAYGLFAAYVRKDRDRPAVPRTEALRRFVRDLRRRYDRPGDGTDDPPWAGTFRAAEGFMIVPVNKARAVEVREVVRELARQHGLTAYEADTHQMLPCKPGANRHVRRELPAARRRPALS